MRHEIVPMKAAHVAALADAMRDADRREVEAMGFTGQKGLWRSYRASVIACAAFVDGEIAAAWGCAGCVASGVGTPWLLTTHAAERVPLTYVKVGRDAVEGMLSVYRRLYGLVSADYARAIRFLLLLGFSVSEPFPFGPQAAMFCRYERAR